MKQQAPGWWKGWLKKFRTKELPGATAPLAMRDQTTRQLDLPVCTVAFVVPTKGRRTLLRALDSLQKQLSPRWRALVVLSIPATASNLDDESAHKEPPAQLLLPRRHQADARFSYMRTSAQAFDFVCRPSFIIFIVSSELLC